MASMEQINSLKKTNQSELLKKRNVTGVGVGYKVTKGKQTDKLCIVVMVRKKVDVAQLAAQDVVPKDIEGIETDVIEVGDIVAHKARTDLWRPAPPGVSIGHVYITAGTFGAVVRDKETGKKLILSNNHVLANSNEGKIGDTILQPGAADGGKDPQHRIASLLRFIEINMEGGDGDDGIPDCPVAKGVAGSLNLIARLFGSKHQLVAKKIVERPLQSENLVDAAVAEPVTDDVISTEILDVGEVKGTRDPELNLAVVKSGRTTTRTEGTITTVSATIQVGYGGTKIATFEDQILTSNMSEPGDSGSLLLAKDTNEAVGLLFAGSDQVTVHNSILHVMNLLNIDFEI